MQCNLAILAAEKRTRTGVHGCVEERLQVDPSRLSVAIHGLLSRLALDANPWLACRWFACPRQLPASGASSWSDVVSLICGGSAVTSLCSRCRIKTQDFCTLVCPALRNHIGAGPRSYQSDRKLLDGKSDSTDSENGSGCVL